MEAHGNDLVRVVALLAAGVVAVPIFRRLGLGSVLGYLDKGEIACGAPKVLPQLLEALQ